MDVCVVAWRLQPSTIAIPRVIAAAFLSKIGPVVFDLVPSARKAKFIMGGLPIKNVHGCARRTRFNPNEGAGIEVLTCAPFR